MLFFIHHYYYPDICVQKFCRLKHNNVKMAKVLHLTINHKFFPKLQKCDFITDENWIACDMSSALISSFNGLIHNAFPNEKEINSLHLMDCFSFQCKKLVLVSSFFGVINPHQLLQGLLFEISTFVIWLIANFHCSPINVFQIISTVKFTLDQNKK